MILSQDRTLPLVAVDIWYHVGAANEEPGRTGFAHLFEHMMFTGSKHIPRGVADKLLEGVGGTDSNASTSFDRTNYFDTVPSNQLELALWVHADRMGYLLDSLDQADAKFGKSATGAYGATSVDIAAPGVGITSSWNTNDTAVNTISGIDELRSTSVEGVSQVFITFLTRDASTTFEEFHPWTYARRRYWPAFPRTVIDY